MRAVLQIAFAVNVVLFIWHEFVLAWLVRRQLGLPGLSLRALPYPVGTGVRDSVDDLFVRGNARLARAWHISDAAWRWAAMTFLACFIVVFAQARWPVFWFLLKSQWPTLLTGTS